MPRRNLHRSAGHVFHILNRSVRRERLFFDEADYQAFEDVLRAALARTNTRLLGYCLMPNHWHLVMWPQSDEVPRFMHWLTATHTRRWHMSRGSRGTGHVYQNRYHAVPVQTERHLLTVLRYVERNPLRAQLVARAEDWRWSSLWRRCNFCDDLPLAPWPISPPADWVTVVNEPQTLAELGTIRRAIRKGQPIGSQDWSDATAPRFGLRLRAAGRPRKARADLV